MLRRSVRMRWSEFDHASVTPEGFREALRCDQPLAHGVRVEFVRADGDLVVTLQTQGPDAPCAAYEAKRRLDAAVRELNERLEGLKRTLARTPPGNGKAHSILKAVAKRPADPVRLLIRDFRNEHIRTDTFLLSLEPARQKELLERSRRRTGVPTAADPPRTATRWPGWMPALPSITFAAFVVLAAVAWATPLTNASALAFAVASLLFVAGSIGLAITWGVRAWWKIGLLAVADALLIFAAAYGLCWYADPGSISIEGDAAGELFLLSLSMGAAGGAFDMTLEGTARVVAFAQLLLALGGASSLFVAAGHALNGRLETRPGDDTRPQADPAGLHTGDQPCPICGG